MTKKFKQLSLFDDEQEMTKTIDGKEYSTEKIIVPKEVADNFFKYNLDFYLNDLQKYGLKTTWDYICQFVIDNSPNLPKFLNTDNFGELYEIGLAFQDKLLKKKSGQYYTPDDVALVMSKWLSEIEGEAVCDVACGTGKLILTYLALIGYEKTRELISSGNLYLYDFDNVALKICKTIISAKYGLDIANKIHDVFCDFLDNSILLPSNCKVISNPPYAGIDEIQDYWNHTDVLLKTKELYSSFMEKIFVQSTSAVIITPFSFISGEKFYPLRKLMCEQGQGFIVSFDNVPGNIFCGRKHGIFNTNTANSVRAAITVMEKNKAKLGYRISPLIRFKNEERKTVLNNSVLMSMLPEEYQVIDNKHRSFEKVFKNLIPVFERWKKSSNQCVKDIVTKDDNGLLIDMPNTCRYFTTASTKKLKRGGSIVMYAKDEEMYDFLYCFINSSFTYWWWRIYDGGITYPSSLLMSMPIITLNDEDRTFFKKMRIEMAKHEKDYVVTKVNAGVIQENIKFPEKYRNEINKHLLKMLEMNVEPEVFDLVHANSFSKEQMR